MSKDTFYFSHDYNVRNDAKIKKLLSKHGLLGYGIFWAIIEDLYNNANALPTDYDTIAYDLRVDKKVVESVVNDFDLFVFNEGLFGSLAVQNRIEIRDLKSVKARESANKRWNKDANALPTQCAPNAIKESKVKEIKVKESKVNNILVRKENFAHSLQSYLPIYGKDLLNDFFLYWTEQNASKTKLRFEREKTWDTDLRLKRWAKNDKNFNKNTPSKIQTIIDINAEVKRLYDAEANESRANDN